MSFSFSAEFNSLCAAVCKNKCLLFFLQERDLELELGDDYILDLQSKNCFPLITELLL